MEDYDLIQVLWVEDDEKVTKTYPAKAKQQFGLQLVDFPYWEKAHEELKNHYDRWSAIILDAKCKFKSGSDDNAVEFLREALKDISVLAKERGRVIPWYVLTGGDANEVSYSINEERLMWDKDWTETHHRNFYSKATDRDALYSRIKKHYQESHRLQIQKKYSAVFEAIDNCEMGSEASRIIEDLLIPIHYQIEGAALNYNKQFNEARKCLELIFRSMGHFGLLPDWGGEVNINWSCFLLDGQDIKVKSKKEEIIVIENSHKDWRKTIPSSLFRFLANILNPASHPGFVLYLNSVQGSTYLLKSIAFQLCDCILWYSNYLRTHKDIERNKQYWRVLRPEYLKNK